MAEDRIVESIDDEDLQRFDRFFTVPVIMFNDNQLAYLNESCKSLLGYDGIESIDQIYLHLVSMIESSGYQQYVRPTLAQNEDTILREVVVLSKNNTRMWLEYSGRVVSYKGEKFILATVIDNTEKHKIEADLLRSSRMRTLMLEITQSILSTEDLDEMFQLILKNAIKALKKSSLGSVLIKKSNVYTVASYIGYDHSIKDFILPYEESFLYKATNGKMDRIVCIPDLIVYDIYRQVETNFGAKNYIKSTITAPIYIKGSLFGIINIDAIETNAFDEDDVKAMEFIRNNIEIALANHLQYKEKALLARHDRLTQLFNRSYFEEQFEIIKKKALRYNEEFNVVMFDINGLKIINDSYGHLVGDKVIKKIADVIEKDTRKSDILARLGGDEFIGIFFNSDIPTLHQKFITLLGKLTNEPLSIEGSQVVCSFSYGISSFPDEGDDLDNLIRLADARMYAFKKKAATN